MNQKLAGVILAAGKGTRITPFSGSLPKPVLPVGNRPLAEYHVEMMKCWGVSEIIVVVGHLAHSIVDVLGGGERFGIPIRYIEQDEILGLAHAVGKVEPAIDSPFVVLLGDLYLQLGDMRPAIQEVVDGAASAVLISCVERDPAMIRRNFSIQADSEGRVSQVIEKPRHAVGNVKGAGLYVFDKHIFDAIRRTPRTALRNEYELTESIQILIEDGRTVTHRPIATADINLTVPGDLLAANLMELHRRGLPHLVAAGARLAPGVRVDHSVIGEGADIRHPVHIAYSLVFPGTCVTADHDIEGAILYRDQVIPTGIRRQAWSASFVAR
ncbi:MAG: NTP transferase domain-containing protein [Acidobacteria bacterium]|nr:NTP transferase domain-containing protein [Acidobacteriota bacterium]